MLQTQVMTQIFCWLFWNPHREAFSVPFLDRPVTWYGIFFASGIAFCYLMLIAIFKHQIRRTGLATSASTKTRATFLVDRLLWYAVIGTLIGARLGHVLFYDPSYFFYHPVDIIKVWQGGLASHGAAIGIFLAVYIYYLRYRDDLPGNSFWDFLDLFVIPIPIAGACIRMGNFINQEILGTPSELPWAVIFGHPIDGRAVVPRHPVMLYEAAAYIVIFLILFTVWKTNGSRLKTGLLSGLFFVLVFSARFILEFFKVVQTDLVVIPGMKMGQLLSIPFIILGFCLILYRNKVTYTPKSPPL